MANEWREYAKEIKAVLGLEGSPVAITYAWEAPKGVKSKKCRCAMLC